MIEYFRETFSQNENQTHTLLGKFINLTIFLSIVTVVIESEQEIIRNNRYLFFALEISFGIFFAIEYIFRIIFSGTDKRYQGFLGKIRYFFTPKPIVDF